MHASCLFQIAFTVWAQLRKPRTDLPIVAPLTFEPAEDNTTLAVLSFSPDVTQDEKAALQREFRNEVLDQDLREVIGAETAGVRNAVLAYAFSRTGLQGGDAV